MPRGNKQGVKLLNAASITALRTEILSLLDQKGQIPKGVTEELSKKYNIGETTIGWHKRQAQKGRMPGKQPKPVNGHAPEQEQQRTLDMRKPASREEIDFATINADIEAGMSVDDIREKHNISDSLVYKIRKDKQEEEPITPLTPERIARVIDIITNLGKAHPDKFTRLDFLGQISKKYATILAEII